jgi:hypothetical protein
MSIARCHLVVPFVVIVALAGSPVFAQEPLAPQPGRAYRGLFGGGSEETHQGLVLDARIGGGYDNNLITSEVTTPGTTAPAGRKGGFEQGSVALTYAVNLSRVSIDLRAMTDAVYHAGRKNPLVQTHRGSGRMVFDLWPGARMNAGHTFSYRPYYYLPGLPAAAIEEESPYASIELDDATGAIFGNHTTNASVATFNQSLSTRLSLLLNYQYVRGESTSGVRDFLNRGGAGGINVTLAKGLSLRLGYGQYEGRYGASSGQQRVFTTRNIDAGINYSRALSLTRKTTIAFTSGTTAVATNNRTFYRLIGGATLNRELGRTWSTGLIYRRGVSFDETFAEPVPIDAVSLGLNGLFSRKLSFRAAIGKVRGRLGFDAQAGRIDTSYGRSALTYGLSKNVAMNLDYSYFRYGFDGTEALPLGLVLRRGERQRVRLFVRLWAPIFGRQNRGAR